MASIFVREIDQMARHMHDHTDELARSLAS
jgi:hypothetical protein